MTTLADIAPQLKEPFALDAIDFLPKGKVERDGKTLCMALPYADPRVYQDRLNAVAYGEWSTPAPVVVVAGNKLICYVTVILCGVAHTDVGEAVNNEENTGTEAFAQAFKRACSQFGLGRYLYDLEKEWVPFNAQRKMIELKPEEKRAIVCKMYQKAGIAISGPAEQAKDTGKSNGHAAQPQQQAMPAQPALVDHSIEELQALVKEVYGPAGKWEKVRGWVIDPQKYGDMPDSLITIEQRLAIYNGLVAKLQAKGNKPAA